MTSQQIIDAAMALSATERTEIAGQLLASVQGTDVELDLDPEFQQLILDRMAAYDRGEVQGVDWEDVASRIRASLDRNAAS